MKSKQIFTTIIILVALLLTSYAIQTKNSDNPVAEESEDVPSETIFSLEKVDGFPLYVTRYELDYNFSQYLETGRIEYSFSSGAVPSCTCFASYGGNETIVGRNFDFPKNPALLVYTDPPDSYASVSMVDLGFFGFDMNHLPESGNSLDSLKWVPYLPFDGMNEHGLAVTMAAIPHAEPPRSSNKVTIGEIQVLRLFLDYAKNVEEALELLNKYNVERSEIPIHYLVADREGNSVIIEFLDEKVVLINSTEPWQVITNFIIHDSTAPELTQCQRYQSTYGGLRDVDGRVSNVEALNLLEDSSQSSTLWSNVYNLDTCEIQIVMGRKYGNTLNFTLDS